MSNRDIAYVPLLTEDNSFQLVRTNPKLTGNIKIAISEEGGMWLESIKANPELSKDLYSKVPIDIKQSHPANIFRFLNSGSTPNEITFDLTEQVDLTKTSKNFKDQYDFSHYFSGVKYLASNKYVERMSYFAPIYLKKDVPDYFIIFKIEDPANFPLDEVKQKYDSGESKTDYLIDLFNKASIIKTFDLRAETVPGKYLRDYLNSSNFPASPLSVSYEEDDFTTWNGILINEGTFGSRGELTYDLYSSSNPLKFFEENITNGFSRNGIIFPNILNLEFVFNDDSSAKYDFNRYLGVYVNAIELSKLDIDLDRAYLTRGTWENTPRFRKNFLETDDVVLTQSNPNGVIVPFKNSIVNFSEFTSTFTDSDNLFINYLSDKDNNLYMPNLTQPFEIEYDLSQSVTLSRVGTQVTAILTSHGYETGDLIVIASSDSEYSGEFLITKIDDNTYTYAVSAIPASPSSNGTSKKELNTGQFRFANTKIDLGLFFGQSRNLFLQDLGESTKVGGHSYGVIKIEYIGKVNTFTQLTVGTGYISSLNISTTGGSGTGLTFDIIDNGSGGILSAVINQPGTGYRVGDTITISGGSGATIKITDVIQSNLNNYDEIRIYHPNGTQIDSIGKYDLIVATQTYPLIPNPGEYYVYNDYDGILGFDEFYMNGTGTASQIASALTGCINGIRNAAFSAYQYDDRVFIKLRPTGDFDTLHKISFVSPTSDYSVLTINDLYTGSQLVSTQFSFLGGSKEIGNRLILDAGHLTKINQNFDSILIKSSDSWSKIRKVSQYIDEITETNSTTQALRTRTIDQYENKIVVVLEENETPTITNKEFVMKPKFRPSFGLLSFYLIKDLDFDFYSSTYTNFPNIDLYEYYFIPEKTNLLSPGIDYVVYGGKIVYLVNKGTGYLTTLNVSTTSSGSGIGLTVDITANSIGQIEYINIVNPGANYVNGEIITISSGNFDATLELVESRYTFTPSILTSYSILGGSPIVTYRPLVSDTLALPIITGTNSNIIPINDVDGELKEFGGFSILKDPSKIVPQNTSSEYELKTKYLNGLTDTEYDFYKENESLDFALRSKIIPYITKWGIKNGKDTRDNPYRLNTELVFGRNNFSPDHEDRTQNPVNFTHEWFYIESKFGYINDESTIAQNTNYFEISLDDTALVNDPDYFINYFTYTPSTLAGKEIADTQFRYSSLIKNSAGQYEAFFKGFKIAFKDVTDPAVFGADGKPVANENSTRFEGYKFSCILKPIKEDINDQTQQPVSYKVIEHRDNKFIVIVIEVVLGDVDDLSIDPYWKSGSNAILNTTNFNDTVLFTPINPAVTQPFATINGDYRITFDANSVSNVTHTLLYSLKNKKYNNLAGAYSNTKMASKLDLASGVDIVDNTIKRLPNINIPNYPAILPEDIIKPTENTPIFIKDTSTGFDLFLIGVNSFVPITPIINTIDYSLDQFVHYDGTYQIGLVIPTSPLTLYSILPASLTSIISNYYVFKVLTGGENYYERLLEKISFAKFKKYTNELNSIVQYYSYTDTGILAADPNFYIEIPDVSQIEKANQVITRNTESIPIQFAGQIDIGTAYEVANLSVKYELNRYKGEYEPLTQNYSIYQSNYKFKNNLINDLSLSNTRLNSDVSSLLTIQNFNHIKVADSQILVLESDESYLPIYPKINEVAIGKKDYFLLRGNWDWGFHHRYTNKETSVPVSGALRVEEDDSFLAKLITLPEAIELEDFNIEYIDATQEFNTVDISKIEIVAKETPLTVEGVINVNNVLTRYLIEDGIDAKFNEYLINSNQFIGNFNSISDPDILVSSYVREYIKLNILKLYDIDTNEFYSKQNTALVSTSQQAGSNPNSIEFVFLNDQQRFTQGYNILKSLQINKKDKLILKFSFAKKQGSGLSISPKIKIKFI